MRFLPATSGMQPDDFCYYLVIIGFDGVVHFVVFVVKFRFVCARGDPKVVIINIKYKAASSLPAEASGPTMGHVVS